MDKEEQDKLEKIVRSSLSPVRLAQRAQIVLMASDGMRNQDIAKALGIGRVKVSRWRNRYAQSGLAGIERDLPRGAPPQKVDIKRLVDLTTQHKPAGATHWSTRKAAAELGVNASTISRHWRRLGLKPHLEQTFK
ncbi:helix-turn-helix domain-containing protein, partial [Thiolapillus sp.]|uniref:helix-turn-helix domain-containing protein n=1 Tax=Thiolapillus sp. TaxID=2017437 RepID=UPI003AF6792B